MPKPLTLPNADTAMPGRAAPLWQPRPHWLSGRDYLSEMPAHWQCAQFGLGCFWGAERLFWQTAGVELTAVGYAGGTTPHPSYEEVCSGRTGHAEVVKLWFDPARVSYAQLLKIFFEAHDPTQGMRQGNDRGTQYRSVIHSFSEAQQQTALKLRAAYDAALQANGKPAITTDLCEAPTFYFAEDAHQQYLAKHPDGYCGLRGTGVSCAI